MKKTNSVPCIFLEYFYSLAEKVENNLPLSNDAFPQREKIRKCGWLWALSSTSFVFKLSKKISNFLVINLSLSNSKWKVWVSMTAVASNLEMDFLLIVDVLDNLVSVLKNNNKWPLVVTDTYFLYDISRKLIMNLIIIFHECKLFLTLTRENCDRMASMTFLNIYKTFISISNDIFPSNFHEKFKKE